MPSPYPVTALLSSLLFLMRHEPHATADLASLLRALRVVREGCDLTLEAEAEGLRINGKVAALDAPGTALVCEQMLLLGIRAMALPAALSDEDLLRLVGVLTAYPGTYAGFSDVLGALGGTASRITLTRVTSEFQVFRPMPWRPRPLGSEIGDDRRSAEMPDIRRDESEDFGRHEEIGLGTEAGDADGSDHACGAVGAQLKLAGQLQRQRIAVGAFGACQRRGCGLQSQRPAHAVHNFQVAARLHDADWVIESQRSATDA